MELSERFWSKVDKTDTCWLWRSSIGTRGYGLFTVAGKRRLAHRVVHEATTGVAIPVGLQIDHLCRVKHCVRPDHLEVVTPRENVLRSDNRAGLNARKDVCDSGHPFDAINTYWRPTGGRGCKECRRAAARKWSPKRRR